VGAGAVVVTAGIGAFYFAKQARPAPGSQPPGSVEALPEWVLDTVTDKLSDTRHIQATSLRATDNGGKLYITADCSPTAIAFGFEYHGKTKEDTYLDTVGDDAIVHIGYRFDQGDVHEALSKSEYSNSADILFGFDLGDDRNSGSPADLIAKGALAFAQALVPGVGPQDLRGLLHANEVRFELPLARGFKQVISIHPQDPTFQSFVRSCKIDLKRIDAVAAARAAKDAPPAPIAPAAPDAAAPAVDYGTLGRPDLTLYTDIDPELATRAPADDLELFRKNEQEPPQNMSWDALGEHADYQRALFYVAAAAAPDQITQQDWIWVRADEKYLIRSSCENAGSAGVRYQLSADTCASEQ
jgi:hypothetical protein